MGGIGLDEDLEGHFVVIDEPFLRISHFLQETTAPSARPGDRARPHRRATLTLQAMKLEKPQSFSLWKKR